jgi:nitrate/nitrite transporter NarK
LFGLTSPLQYFAPFAFTAFSNEIYENKFGFSAANASFLSGVMNLIGGFVGPIAGPASDYLGFRALSLAGFGCLNVIGFTLLAATTVNPWVATILFSLAFGWGDTVAYPNIALLAGDDRAAVGYAIFGLVGGAVMWVVPFAAGELVTDDGNRISWYPLLHPPPAPHHPSLTHARK